MKNPTKIILVLGGYAAVLPLSFLAAFLAGYARQAVPALASVSQGMSAFGDLVFFVVLLSLFPTTLALYFLRNLPGLWTTYAWTCLVLGSTAPLGAIVNVFIGLMAPFQGIWPMVGALGLIRVGASPFLVLVYLGSSAFAPRGRVRLILWIAAGSEISAFLMGALAFWVFGRG